MFEQVIAGLFKDAARGETALEELKAANFTSAQISEVASDEAAAPATRELRDPKTDFFADHATTGSEFRDNLAGLGIAKTDAEYFEDGVARGGALVTVKGGSRTAEALEILRRNGADLGSQGKQPVSGVANDAATAGTTERTVQLRAERLAIDKVRVASGAARIGKTVVTEQKSVDVPVMHEELVIERHAASGATASGTIGADETITVPLSRDEVTVSKQTYATEEVEVGKRTVQETEHVSETLRREELVVDGPKTAPAERKI